MRPLFLLAPLVLFPGSVAAQTFTILPAEYEHALRNPLKGFRPLTEDALYGEKRFATITHSYFKWNELENDEADTAQKIKDLCDLRWAGVAEKGIKVIPSIYLDFNEDEKYWPADMTAGDYSSPQFKRRLARLIRRLGECWDHDPRVAWVETSIIGLWGEQHAPSPTPEIQRIMGDAFTAAFQEKKFLVRHPNEFTDYQVGYYWGSWAHGAQLDDDAHGAGIARVNRQTGRWKTHPMEGEIAYNWGTPEETLGGSPDATLTSPEHRETLLDSLRNLHGTGLGWVAKYSQDDPAVRAGAEEVQKAFGYRFVLKGFRCAKRAAPGGSLRVELAVLNTGSAPFYADWPVEFSLLDPDDRSVAYRTTLDNIDIRQWLSGDDWDAERNAYRQPPKLHRTRSTVTIPADLRPGKYVAAIAVLDPAGQQPALRLAIKNYFAGGRHPLGYIGIGTEAPSTHKLAPELFDDPMAEPRLSYQDPAQPKRSGHQSIPSRFDTESDPDNEWVIGADKTTLKALGHGSWVCYRRFDFGTATNHLRVRASSASQGGRIELRTGSADGKTVGAIDIPPTGDWGKFKTVETPLERPIRGTHDLYLVFVDPARTGEYLFDIASFKFDER